MSSPRLQDPVLFAATRVATFEGQRFLPSASGFFFEREGQLYLVTSRHVLVDEAAGHFPDRIEIELHTDAVDLTRSMGLSVLLYRNGTAVWHQATDSGGEVDVAVVALERDALPAGCVIRPFSPAHLPAPGTDIAIGSPLLVVGFPLGFHDTLHHLPVARQGTVASSFGIRFQGQGYFLTDARTHRGTSGAPVLMREPSADAAGEQADLRGWRLLGVHSARMDMSGRDLALDESLGLNCAWYADILNTLTAPRV